ncbi:3',5'-cyclic AMP phosphodiesterase CpdA [Pararhizobium capsulatum DSM 1112]|uniref:3',5'-cyclic AMP phosphodiesterase CpdA n=1 Tax=Pararhizobium capsulatum DSM 1112 TaxID=1121113 RepID=A0ABU0BTB6_9HYPH|nr:metallophosphoesterase [Pararhizobium capsulatum]MDQ0321494.1 3',5'-cyclic AMP phosphodiesterase CpdA [Pararhizobium capsulatum DSM 1112]
MPLSRNLPVPRLAIVADAHFHDLYGDYGVGGISEDDGRQMSVRLLADTVKSTRVFNESYAALHRTLEDIAAAGIHDVVLLGDYSDDGQVETVRSVRLLLEDFEARLGLRFHATVGNHDIFAADGRHRTKRFLNADGGYTLATSDASLSDPAAAVIAVSEAMYCRGYPDGLSEMAAFGFFPRGDERHWETPFGMEAAAEQRLYEVRSADGKIVRRLMDASYLVEPMDGVWLLMIDVNVFAPMDGILPGEPGDFADSTSAGWNGMLQHKTFVFDWLADVSRRAEEQGKCLLAFSHYPALDPLDGTRNDEVALLGETGMTGRIPAPAVAEALMEAGISVHFSGHLHVNDTARAERDDGRFLINVAVPALVAFPSGYKVLSVFDDRLEIETRQIGDIPVDKTISRCYDREIATTGLHVEGLKAVQTYGEFLSAHLGHLVGRRHLKREWPKPLADMLRAASLCDLVILSQIAEPIALRDARTATERFESDLQSEIKALVLACRSLTAMDFLRDWYRLRMASELALPWIDPARMSVYQNVGALYRGGQWEKHSAQAKIARLFSMFDRYRSGLPSDNFAMDRASGAIIDRKS